MLRIGCSGPGGLPNAAERTAVADQVVGYAGRFEVDERTGAVAHQVDWREDRTAVLRPSLR